MIEFFRRGNKTPEPVEVLRTDFCSRDQWDTICGTSMEQPVYIFKHSSRCGVSSMVRSRFEKQLMDRNAHYFHLHIQASRSLSDWLSEALQIRHESPQLIAMSKGEVLAHDSHYGILDILPNL